jgi:DeoR/GlpR family transcriptional regulator of sugar metabolism
MRTDERQQALVDRVLASGSASVAELVALVGASEATVRRDLAELDERGAVRRVHGGARRPGLRGVDVVPGAQPHANAAGRDRVARAAAALLGPGEAVVLDSGTTCTELARALTGEHRVVPLSLPVAETLAGRDGIEVTVPGGDLRPGSLSFVGPLTERALGQLRVDTAVISPCGLDLTHGATAFDVGDAAVMQAAMRAAERRVLVCDASKWGQSAFAWFADLRELDVVVTDHEPTADEAALLAEAGVEVVPA